ncbi:MAG: YceH family protein [Solirubrobacteraceae bacterium]
MDLLPTEIRALGCLIEKQRTTPDAYPLTLNSLRLACNQSTNRDPVVSYEEPDVRDALRRLERRGLVRFASGAGSRAAKYRHLLAERLPMDDSEQALLCVLMLRGAQTPGELKQRADRLHPFAALSEVEETLERLVARELVARVRRRPGQKEERFGQLLSADAQDELALTPRDGDGTQRHPGGAPPPIGETPPRAVPAPAGAVAGPSQPQAGAVAGPSEPQADAEGWHQGGDADAGAFAAESGVTACRPSASALAVEVDRLRERVSRLEGELEAIRAELGIEALR